MFSFKKKELVGIDIGTSSVKMVQLKVVRGGYELVKLGMAPFPPEAIIDNRVRNAPLIVEAVHGLLSSQNVTVREAACSLSGNSVIIKKLSFPTMSADELAEQITWEAEQHIPFDINDVNIDFHILGPDVADPGKINVILAASKKDLISSYQAMFSQAGLTLSVIDVDAFALQNAFEANYDPAPGDVIALVNMGETAMNLNIVRGTESLFTRDIQQGGGLYTQEIQKRLAIRMEDAERMKISASDSDDETVRGVISQVNETLAMELSRSLDFYNASIGEERVSKLYVSGGCCKTPYLLEAFRKRLDLPVEIITPFQKIICPERQFDPAYLKEMGPHVTVAVGLAMRRYGDK